MAGGPLRSSFENDSMAFRGLRLTLLLAALSIDVPVLGQALGQAVIDRPGQRLPSPEGQAAAPEGVPAGPALMTRPGALSDPQAGLPYPVAPSAPVPHPYADPTVGPKLRVFEPKARVYFDTGTDSPEKLDMFQDGSLVPSINFLELTWMRPFRRPFGHEDWRWGPNLGIGITSQAGDSDDGTNRSSGAPVVICSVGLLCEFPLSALQLRRLREHQGPNPELRELAPTAGLEVGYALGVSSDERLTHIADGAIYVGLSFHVLP